MATVDAMMRCLVCIVLAYLLLQSKVVCVVTWFKTHEITSHHINYSIAYPKPWNKRVLLGYCSHFMSLKPRIVVCDCIISTQSRLKLGTWIIIIIIRVVRLSVIQCLFGQICNYILYTCNTLLFYVSAVLVVLTWFKDNNGNHVLWTIPFVLRLWISYTVISTWFAYSVILKPRYDCSCYFAPTKPS